MSGCGPAGAARRGGGRRAAVAAPPLLPAPLPADSRGEVSKPPSAPSGRHLLRWRRRAPPARGLRCSPRLWAGPGRSAPRRGAGLRGPGPPAGAALLAAHCGAHSALGPGGSRRHPRGAASAAAATANMAARPGSARPAPLRSGCSARCRCPSPPSPLGPGARRGS